MDGMKRYTGLSDCRMFAAVLEERLPMAIYQDQQALITMLRVSSSSVLFAITTAHPFQ
jgi:hypothetical protein